MRPSIANMLKRQIGGFVREYEREVNRPAEPAKKPEAGKTQEAPPRPQTPPRPE